MAKDYLTPAPPAAPAKRLPRPATHGSDDNAAYDTGGGSREADHRLAQRATKGSTIRPFRDTDAGGIQSHDIRTSARLSKNPGLDVRAEDNRYFKSLQGVSRDYAAGRDPYDTVQRPTKRRVTGRSLKGRR
jgi:hypothetical protein